MKALYASLVALAITSPALAASFSPPLPDDVVIMPPAAPTVAGHFGLYYGMVTDTYIDGNYPNNDYTLMGVEGSVGSAGHGGFGWQLDAGFESASYLNFADAQLNYYSTTRATAHANFNVAGMALGGFAGFGSYTDIYNGVDGRNFWYGVEGAKSFGNFALAAQVGLGSSDNSDDSGDYSNQLFGALEGRLFVNDNIMLAANIGIAKGMLDQTFAPETLTLLHYGVEGTMRLGQSNFYANAGYAFSDYTTSGTEGYGNESTFTVGLSMMFGGGLREAYAATPMIDGYYANMVGLKTETYY